MLCPSFESCLISVVPTAPSPDMIMSIVSPNFIDYSCFLKASADRKTFNLLLRQACSMRRNRLPILAMIDFYVVVILKIPLLVLLSLRPMSFELLTRLALCGSGGLVLGLELGRELYFFIVHIRSFLLCVIMTVKFLRALYAPRRRACCGGKSQICFLLRLRAPLLWRRKV